MLTSPLESLVQDLRYSIRSLRRRPGFTVVALTTIALAIGVNTVIFSVVHAVLLRPPQYRDADRIVRIFTRFGERPRYSLAPRDVADFREQSTVFDGFGARYFNVMEATLTGGDEPIHVRTGIVTVNLFSLLGCEPALGRGFVPEDATEFGPGPESDTLPPTPVGVILSHELWLRYSGGDPGILGRTIELDKQLARIVGVMPAGFSVQESGADLWSPVSIDFANDDRQVRMLNVFGRLKPGVTVEQAQAEMDVISSRLQEQVPAYRNQGIEFWVAQAQQDLVRDVRPALLMLQGAVGFLLLLSCANVGNLLLIRARARATEMAIRGALGCGRGRLARQILTEHLVLACSGGLAGLLLAWLGVGLLLSLQPANVPRFETVSISRTVMAFSLGISVLAALLFGVLPAIEAGRICLVDGLKNQLRGSLGRRTRALLGSSVVVEVALSVVLLLGAGAMVRTFVALKTIDPGFEPSRALAIPISLYDRDRYSTPTAVTTFYRELGELVRALPGVESVGSTNVVPFTEGGGSTPYAWDEDSEVRWNARAYVRVVGGDYFRTMQTRVLAGRAFSDLELTEPTSSVIVDETLARDAWPNEDPIGKNLIIGVRRQRVEVVGVVEHVYVLSLREEERGTIYMPVAASPRAAMNLVVRASGDLGSLVDPIRQEIHALDAGLAVRRVTTLDDVVDDVMAPTHFALVSMGVFAGLALALTTIGLYGVISYGVGQRKAEIGIRMAFGADKGQILRYIVGRGAALIAVGAVIGTAATLALFRFMASLVYEVSTIDPATLVSAAIMLSAVGLLASYLPARRATQVDPVEALRHE